MPPKHKTEQQRQQLRTKILDAARELFVDRGIEAVTMREIARRVGYSSTALYLHFADKEALIRELCDTDFLSLAHELQDIDDIPDPLQRLRLLGLAYVRFAVTYPNHYRLMFMTPRVSCPSDSSAVQKGNPEQDAYARLLLMVKDAHQAQIFRPELTDPDLIAQTLWASLHGVCSLQITTSCNDDWSDWRPFEARVALMQEAVMRGLLREPPRG